MGNPRFRLHPSSLNPPALTADDEAVDDDYPPWVLMESQAYVADCKNSTTAVSKTWDSHDIQVTICTRRPPHVSYMCVYSRDAEMPLEPQMLAMEEDLVVLCVTVSCQKDVMKNIDYYVYRATGGVAYGKPSLTLLKRPPNPYNSFYAEHTIVMLCGTGHQPTLGGQTGIYLRPHVHSVQRHYIIAALKAAPWEMQEEFPQGIFILSLYNSKTEDWTVNTISLNKEQRQQYGPDFEHATSKVINIGGDAGTMGFVDLWRGILLCDLFSVKGEVIPSPLRYIKLPSTRRNSLFREDARLARDIAVINGHLKFVELQVHWKESRVC
ncbi:hypothetical protein EJB05_12445 [Eragrostis curvula]|uniref:DUF1618 domain-containing protein n=1 Tax=Eragrostis curvula TaxID=38414 RepID=A0A5J9VS84_9POAL|nr:hypothetical protein EJB05_12445 [Eragrostis curvula]